MSTRILFKRTCIDCKREYTYDLDREGYLRWQEGELIQNALYELDAGARELLVSGICGACFDALFSETPTGWPGDGSGLDDLADYNSQQGGDT